MANCYFAKPDGMQHCYIPFLYVIDFKGAFSFDEAQVIGISHASLYFSETMKGYSRMSETRPPDWSANPSFASLRDYFTNSQ